jgi:maltoporin
MSKKSMLLAAAALGLLSSTAGAVDWNGYFRVGPGQKNNPGGNDSRCFGANMEGGTYRLGNECDTYGEFGLSQGGTAGNVDYKVLFMTNLYRPGTDAGDVKVGVNQIYGQAKGFDLMPNQTVWIGKRFYGRADVHMVDTFFVNMSGTGAGIDGFSLGPASLNVAVFRDGEYNGTAGTGTNPGTRVNLDFTGIGVNPGGKLRVTTVFTDFSGPNGKTGAGLSLQHNQSGILGGDNTLWLQYAQGSAYLNMGFGGGTDDSDLKRWRIVESMQWTKGPLTGQAIFIYGKQGLSNAKETFNTIGGRVAYAFTKNFKLQGELGVSSHKPQGGQTDRLTKFTVAPTFSIGQDYYDRPEFRFYVTSFSFNDAYKATRPGLTKSSKTAVGFQLETWF